MTSIELDDIQRLVVQGYASLRFAAYLPLRVVPGEARRARAWIASRLPHVGSGAISERRAERQHELQQRHAAQASASRDVALEPMHRSSFAFSFAGLGAIGLPVHDAHVAGGFLPEYRCGIAGEAHRSRILGDTGDSAPEHWRWGNAQRPVHLLYMIFCATGEQLAARLALELAQLEGLEPVHEAIRAEIPPDLSEPFGFRDGISQPLIEGSGTSRLSSGPSGRSGAIKAGEFLLGYVNEFGQRPLTPMLPSRFDPEGHLRPAGLGADDAKDFGRNGSYLVVRQLAQDVAGFHGYAEATARANPHLGSPKDIEALMVGRRQDGTPLARCIRGHAADPLDNDFDYWHGDRLATGCPIGAHVRRSNPRNALAAIPLGVSPERAQQRANYHRILRRGRVYRHGDERGVVFLCLQSNIERQFEFVQHTWIGNGRFSGLDGETDPLVGNPNGGGRFTVRRGALPHRIDGLGRFVTVKAAEYFFLPSLSALRCLTALPALDA